MAGRPVQLAREPKLAIAGRGDGDGEGRERRWGMAARVTFMRPRTLVLNWSRVSCALGGDCEFRSSTWLGMG